MTVRRGLTLTALVLWITGCSTTTAPTISVSEEAATPASTGVQFLPLAPALATYDTTFMVIQGEHSRHYVGYADGLSAAEEVFLCVDIPHNAEFVDPQGQVLPPGASVPVRVQIARDSLAFKLEPHGSTFRRPVKLQVDYAYTDLAGTDPGQLKMWYQATDGLTWTQVPVTAEIDKGWLSINLKHFSNYAVAF